MITWTEREEELFKPLEEIFLEIGEEALSMSHYELTEYCKEQQLVLPSTQRTPMIEHWRAFLQNPKVQAYLEEERALMLRSASHHLLNQLGDGRSTGQAQLLTTLEKLSQDAKAADNSPVFIYTYVPLSEEQKTLPNVQILEEDVFV